MHAKYDPAKFKRQCIRISWAKYSFYILKTKIFFVFAILWQSPLLLKYIMKVKKMHFALKWSQFGFPNLPKVSKQICNFRHFFFCKSFQLAELVLVASLSKQEPGIKSGREPSQLVETIWQQQMPDNLIRSRNRARTNLHYYTEKQKKSTFTYNQRLLYPTRPFTTSEPRN